MNIRTMIGPMTANERARGRYMRDGGGHPLQAMIERHIKAVEEQLEKHGTTMAVLSVNLDELQKKSDQRSLFGGGAGYQTKSYGEQVAESASFADLKSGNYHGRARIELKAITSLGGSGGGLITPQHDADIARMPQRRTRVRDLMTVIPATSGSVDYAQQTTRTNAAAPVPEGTQKPYSTYGWTKKNLPMRTIAHLAKLTRQAADDAPQLAAEVDNEMRYGLQLQEDAQLIYGDGTGENLTGFAPLATAYAKPTGSTITSMTTIDQIGLAIVQLALQEFEPDGIVLNPVDWWNMVFTKDSAGGYIFNDPTKMVAATLWGLPVAVTTAQTAGTFEVGNFKLQKLYDRMAPEVLISSENANDFELNLLTMRCEERLALAVRQPGAIIKGTFATS